MDDDIKRILEGDSAIGASDAGKAALAVLAREQAQVEDEIRELETRLADAQRRLKAVSEVAIPALMDELGIESITLVSGERVSVKRDVSASIPKARLDEALAWLRSNGAASLIKNKIVVTFGRGEDEDASSLLVDLQTTGRDVEQSTSVHPQTLGAYVRERIADGLVVPMDLLGVYEYARSKITLPR